ncbi:MAG TPA: enoyl-CoA hydratase-related protein [Candidatus Binatia bacterium]|nr:enoyl-CoA hydratase-related protein [Candidatus Binatia bacterium]
MGAPLVRYAVEDHVATVTLDRPEVRNALNHAAYGELEAAFRRAQRDPEVRTVVLTGSDPAFCSGDDVKQIMLGGERDETLQKLREVRPQPTPAAVAVLECDRPVIAAVNGPAVGWGMDLTLLCDIRLASERARFAELFIQRGVIADLGGLWRLPQVVGPSRAAELLFTGDAIDAREAERIGLVSRVVPHGELLPAAVALARRIAANPPLALRYMKEGLRRATHGDVRELGAWIASTLAFLFATEDHREGARAFVEKRAPRFTGR